ncbi:MAG: hypothetical protein JO180_10260 [Gemmatirosa sp.]|nr:hypothetical protein [Gemmatirosa sp.]
MAEVLYDAARVWFPAWPAAAAGLAAGALGAALLLGARRAGRRGVNVARAGTVLAILGPGWALVIGAGLYGEHARLRAALRAGTFTQYDGLVHDRPSADGSAWVVESGRAAHWYRYARAGLGAPGYRRAGPGTGGLRDGDSVRVADVEGKIARLERFGR